MEQEKHLDTQEVKEEYEKPSEVCLIEISRTYSQAVAEDSRRSHRLESICLEKLLFETGYELSFLVPLEKEPF